MHRDIDQDAAGDNLGLLTRTPGTAPSGSVGARTAAERRFVARGLGHPSFGRRGAETLATFLTDEDAEVRVEAYGSLQRYPLEDLGSLVDTLTRQREQEPWAMVGLVCLLARVVNLGPSAVIGALEGPARAPQRWVQREVIRVLRMCMEADRQASRKCVLAWARHRNEHVRETSVKWLGLYTGAEVDFAIGAMASLSADPSALVRRACAIVLGRHALRSPDIVIPALQGLAADKTHCSVRLAVARGLVHWQTGAPFEALAVLKRLLNDTARAVGRAALRCLHLLAREHPALALGVVTDWHDLREVRRHVVVACLRAVATSTEPQAAARAAGMLDVMMRRQGRARVGAA